MNKAVTNLKPEAEEEWRPGVGYAGLYSVSDQGRVRSERRFRTGKGGKPVAVNERILKPTLHRDGHLRVRLCDGQTKRSAFVHTLVLTAFVGPRPDGLQACHNSGDPSDNRRSNLRWGTPQSNQADRVAHGTSSRGEKNASAKLTPAQALSIRLDPRSHEDIAAEYAVARTTVGSIKSGKTWKHLECAR